MNTTSVTLLKGLQSPAQPEAWERFVQLYTPLLYSWARAARLQESDAADLVQEVLTILVQKLPDFVYDPQRSFRAWLRTILVNKWHDWHKRRSAGPHGADDAILSALVDPGADDVLGEAEYREYLVGRSLQLMQADFHPTTWKACWEYVVSGRPAAEVAQELGITVNAVYHAKSRVLSRLRQELEGLLD